MRLLISIVLAFLCSHAFASDQCDRRAELAGTLAVTKHATIEALRDDSGTGPTSEVWRIMAYMSAGDYEKLGDSNNEIEKTAKLIEKNNLAKDWRIELLIYNEFFRALCEADVKATAIRVMNAKALSTCFGDSPPGRPDFSSCVRAEVDQIRRDSREQ